MFLAALLCIVVEDNDVAVNFADKTGQTYD
jgi:hypothetical protein